MTREIVNYAKQVSILTSTKKEKETVSISELSLRERQIFDLIVQLKTNKEIAAIINVSVNTVKFHVKNIYEKLNIKSRKEVLTLEKAL
ncbi:UNVERIFIED_CONTAM: hypothetical protein GTU68_012169 [Idotea baltica]|nr:hypothetical protein [Idotea baltica]